MNTWERLLFRLRHPASFPDETLTVDITEAVEHGTSSLLVREWKAKAEEYRLDREVLEAENTSLREEVGRQRLRASEAERRLALSLDHERQVADNADDAAWRRQEDS